MSQRWRQVLRRAAPSLRGRERLSVHRRGLGVGGAPSAGQV